MNKPRIINGLIFLLLITNLLLIGYIFFSKSKGLRRHEGPRNIIIERLKFDKNQIAEYDILIKAHRNAIRQSDESILLLKNKLYLNLSQESNAQINDSVANKIGTLQKQVEYINYKHFQDIKRLCHNNQLASFNVLIKDITHLFSRSKSNHPPR